MAAEAPKVARLLGCLKRRVKRHQALSCKYMMRISELTLKPIKSKPPMTLPQARIHGLKQNVERGKQQLQAERERQRQQRDAERKRKEQHKML